MQALGGCMQVLVSLVPKHNALLGSSKCQRATCRTLTLVKTSFLLSKPVLDQAQGLLWTLFFSQEFDILLCSHKESAAASLALRSGAKDYWRKPFLWAMNEHEHYDKCYIYNPFSSFFFFPLLSLFLSLCLLFSASGLSQVIWIHCKYLSVVPYLQFIIYCAIQLIVNTDCFKDSSFVCLMSCLSLTVSKSFKISVFLRSDAVPDSFIVYHCFQKRAAKILDN